MRCECGYEITKNDIIQAGLYLRPFGPIYVAFKYRCPRCGRLGEKLVEYPQWVKALAASSMEAEEAREEANASSSIPEEPITIDEVLDFHEYLKNLKGLPPEIFGRGGR